MNIFDKIEQCYPIGGYSFLHFYCDFNQIKRHLKIFDRIYSIGNLLQINLRSSPKNPKKFMLKLVEADEILDFKERWSIYFKINPISLHLQQ